MSTVPSTQQEGQLWAGVAATGNIPERYLKRGMDNLAQMAFIVRGTTRFLHNLSTRYPKSKVVGTREHRVHEISELDRVLTITVASTSADHHTTFGVSNAQAAQMQANDVLMVKGLYNVVTSTPLVAGQVVASTNLVPTSNIPQPLGYTVGGQPTGVSISRNFGQDVSNPNLFYTEYEQVMVRNVGRPNSASAGNTTITVERIFRGPSARDFGGARIPLALVNTAVDTNNAGALLVGDEILRAAPSWAEGTGPARGFHKNPELDNNFTQEMKYAVEITKESTIEKTYSDKSPLDINKMLRMRQVALDLERTFLFGQKTKTTDPEGKLQYVMGGVIEYIPKDTDHIIKYAQPTLSYPGWLDVTDRVFKLGGSEERDLFCGITMYNEIKKSFWNSDFLRFDEEASKAFDLPVESIVGSGGKINLIPLYSLEEAGWGNRGICIDQSVPALMPVTHDGWDMKIEKDIQQAGDQIYKEQWISIKGLERRYAPYQTILSL